MISYDFEYYRPKTYQEAIEIFKSKLDDGKKPVYYSGGTETVTYARNKVINTGAVIDIKAIEEANIFSEDGDKIIYGSALNLNDIAEKTKFNLMAEVSNKIADHTVRNRLTLGGNICGRLFYKEAVLPIMVADGILVIAGENGIRRQAIMEGFDKRIVISPGEILLQVEIDMKNIDYPHFNIRKEKKGEIDYPLIHIAALKGEDKVRYGISGLCPFPFRSIEMENILNNKGIEGKVRVQEIMKVIPTNVIDDIYGSRDFRRYLFENSVLDIIKRMEEVL